MSVTGMNHILFGRPSITKKYNSKLAMQQSSFTFLNIDR